MIEIQFDKESNYFHLSNTQISYIMELYQNQQLFHRYWGPKLRQFHAWNQAPSKKKTFAAFSTFDHPNESLEFYPLEFSLPYQGDYMEPSLEVTLDNLSQIVKFHFQSYEILDGSPMLDELPHARNNEASPANIPGMLL